MSSAPAVAPRGPARGQRRIKLAIEAAVLAVVVLIAAIAVILVLATPRTGPAELFVVNATQVKPASIGCESVSGELCFSLTAGISATNLRLSDLDFELTNATGQSSVGPGGSPEPVGAGAGVSVLESPTVEAGHWNWSSRAWTNGSSWMVPTTVEIDLIFDSGLQNTTALDGTLFWVSISTTGGSAGTFLP